MPPATTRKRKQVYFVDAVVAVSYTSDKTKQHRFRVEATTELEAANIVLTKGNVKSVVATYTEAAAALAAAPDQICDVCKQPLGDAVGLRHASCGPIDSDPLILALAVAAIICAMCGAEQGVPCQLMHGARDEPHAERVRGLYRLVRCPFCKSKTRVCKELPGGKTERATWHEERTALLVQLEADVADGASPDPDGALSDRMRRARASSLSEQPATAAQPVDDCDLCGRPGANLQHDRYGFIHRGCLIAYSDAGGQAVAADDVDCPQWGCDAMSGFPCAAPETHQSRIAFALDEQRRKFRLLTEANKSTLVIPPAKPRVLADAEQLSNPPAAQVEQPPAEPPAPALPAAPTGVEMWPLNEIEIGERRRKDMGDIRGLADSILDCGLLHPIVLARRPSGFPPLVAGQRRHAAMLLLEWTHGPVRWVDLEDIAKGELQENTVRKDFLPSEMVAIAEAVAPQLEQTPVGRPRKIQESFLNLSQEPAVPFAVLPPAIPRAAQQTRDKVAAFAGVSGRTLDKATAVVQAAREEPEKYAPLVDQMDKTKKVDAAYKQLREKKRHEEIRRQVETAPPSPPPSVPASPAASTASSEQPPTSAAPAEWRYRIESMDALDFLRSLPDGSGDFFWIDGPYFIGSKGGGTKVGKDFQSFTAGEDGWDSLQWSDDVAFLGWQHKIVLEVNRILRPTGNAVICFDRARISHLWDLCALRGNGRVGLKPKNILAWHKTNAAPNPRKNFDSGLELAVWADMSPDSYFQRTPGQCSSVWSGPLVSQRDKWPHPTAKPVEWILSHLRVLAVPGQVVIDPFAGSGATVEAALRFGCRVVANDRIPPKPGEPPLPDADRYALMCRARAAETLREVQPA